MNPKTEEQALLMYAAGLEYLKRTNSKLLPVAEQDIKSARKPVTAVDFDALKDSEVTMLRKRITELEAELMRLKAELNFKNQPPSTWPVRPYTGPIYRNGTGNDPFVGLGVGVCDQDTVIIKGNVTFKSDIDVKS